MSSPGLSDAERAELRALMSTERARLVAQSAVLRETFDELVAAADLEPPDDEHDPDGTTAYERAQVISMRSAFDREVAAIDAALAGLDADTYGTCVGCGAPIPFGRLAAILGTDRCITCATGRR